MMKESDVRIGRTVLDFLRHLNSWYERSPGETDLRRDSHMLRILLVDRRLQDVWTRHMGKVPMYIKAVKFEGMWTDKQVERATLLAASTSLKDGARFHGFSYGSSDESPYDASEAALSAQQMRLDAFVSGTCISIHGVRVSRREIVKFVCNKLGGTHIQTDLHEPGEQALEQINGDLTIRGRPVVYDQLLEIGQRIVCSPDVKRLVSKLSSS